jgi:hypothetical protein
MPADLDTPATKGDVVRIHEKLDKLSTDIAVMQASMHTRPCPELVQLKADLREKASDWRKAAIGGLVKVAVTAIIGFVGWLIGAKG